MNPTPEPDGPTPYADAAWIYRGRGWRGTIPLPYATKALTLRGWTGAIAGDRYPSDPDVYAWLEENWGSGNLALRLPPDVLGVDVDEYDDKHGLADLIEATGRWGDLPPTWSSSARGTVSAIRFYRIPPGLRWPSGIGTSIETIHAGHRYAVVWPSHNPHADAQYRWYRPDGTVSLYPPHVAELAELPAAWVEGLTGLRTAEAYNHLGYDTAAVQAWLAEREGGAIACRAMKAVLAKHLPHLAPGKTGAHDAMNEAVMALVRMAELGHTGIDLALGQTMTAFAANVTIPRAGAQRDAGSARDEFLRSVSGAVSKVAGNPQAAGSSPADPCLSTTVDDWVDSGARPLDNTLRPEAPDDEDDTAPPSSLLDLSGQERLDALHAAELAAEVAKQRLRKEARHVLDTEDAERLWREPVWTVNLTKELDIPDEQVQYTIADICPVGSNVTLGAQFKAGKTTFTLNLARCLVDREPFLAKYPVLAASGRVAIWNYEVGAAMFRRWMREAGIRNTDDITHLPLRGLRLPMISPRVQDWAVSWLVEHDIKVWIIDPYARAYLGTVKDENDNTGASEFLDILDQIKDRAGVSEIIMPAHTGREKFAEGEERVRAATRLDDWPDVRWMLTKGDDDLRYFKATGRDVEEPEGKLVYTPETRRLRLETGGRNYSKVAEIMREIKAAIRVEPGINTTKLREVVKANLGELNLRHWRPAIDELEDSGWIRVEKGQKNESRHYEDVPTEINNEGS